MGHNKPTAKLMIKQLMLNRNNIKQPTAISELQTWNRNIIEMMEIRLTGIRLKLLTTAISLQNITCLPQLPVKQYLMHTLNEYNVKSMYM